MIIRVVGHDKEPQFPFSSAGPWSEFHRVLVTSGHIIQNSNYGAKTDALISNSHSDEAIREAIMNKVPVHKRVLIIWEPEIVDKRRYSKEVLNQYGLIFSPSPIWAEKTGGKVFKWPQDSVLPIEKYDTWKYRSSRAVMIQGNKWSVRKGELYSLRRKVIKKLSYNLDLFGEGWNRGLYPDFYHIFSSLLNSKPRDLQLASLTNIGRTYSNYLGRVENKSQILRRYKVSIVIENSPDFVSEKLFDSISSGCITIYVGPKISRFGLNELTTINAKESPSDVNRKLDWVFNLSTKDQYELAQNQNILLRKVSQTWNNSVVLRDLAKDLVNYLEFKY